LRQRLLYINPRAQELLGQKLAGSNLENFSKTIKVLKPNGDLYPIEDMPITQALKGEIVRNIEVLIELPNKKRLNLLVSSGPILGDNNEVLSAIFVFDDISERITISKKLEQYTTNLERLVEERTTEIKTSEKQYHEIYDSFGEALIATNWDLEVIHWNKAAERVTTVNATNALGKKVYEVLPEFLTVDITPYFEALRQNKAARFMMNVISRETKKPSIFEISTYPSSQGIIIIVEDKTEEEQTKRLSAIGATAGMVGHDIRSPLQSILSDTFLLKEALSTMPGCQTKEDVAESLDGIERNVVYINKIVQDLQDYSRPITPEYSDVNLAAIFDSIFKTIAIPGKIKLYLQISEIKKICSDAMLLQRVLTNLVNNAIQAMPNGGDLKIEAKPENSKVVLTVADTGVGIPNDVKSKLFIPLMTTKTKGQGFGLAVSKRLVEALNGTISFESEEGKGTKFIITLPLNQ
jgi:PAS domain S-box-containing protein